MDDTGQINAPNRRNQSSQSPALSVRIAVSEGRRVHRNADLVEPIGENLEILGYGADFLGRRRVSMRQTVAHTLYIETSAWMECRWPTCVTYCPP